MSAQAQSNFSKIDPIPDIYRMKWQSVLDTIVDTVGAAGSIITHLHEDALEIWATNNDPNGIFTQGEMLPLPSGRYCETVISTRQVVEIHNAADDPRWSSSPEIECGLTTYLGYPLILPTGEVFGTICVFDTQDREYTAVNKRLMQHFADSVGLDLAMIYRERLLEEEIQERLRIEQALNSTEYRYKLIFDNAGDAILLHDADGRIIDANRKMCEIYGYTIEEMLRLRVYDLADRENTAFVKDRIGEILEKGSKQFRSAHQSKNGTKIPVEVTARLVQYDSRQAVLAVIRDTSVQSISESEVTEQSHFLDETQKVAHIGNWIWEIETDTLSFSDEIFRILGYPSRENPFNYDRYFNCIHPGDRQMVHDCRLSAFTNNKDYDVKYRIVQPAGRVRYVHSRASVIRNEDGLPAKFSGTLQDITDAVQLEHELLERRERYLQLIENLGENFVVFRTTLDGRTTYASRGMKTVFGLDAESVLGANYLELIQWTEESLANTTAIDNELVAAGKLVCVQKSFYHTDGSLRWVSINAHLAKDDDGKPAFIEGICEDITAQKLTQTALQNSEVRFQLAMIASNDGLWDSDLVTGQAYYSPRWKAMLGYQEHELVDTIDTWIALLHPDDKVSVIKEISTFEVMDNPRFEMEFRMRHKLGHYINVLARGILIRDEYGNPVRRIGTHSDITERKRIERELEDSTKRLKNLIEDLGDNVFLFRNDLHGRALYASPGALAMFGLKADEIIGGTALELVNWLPESRQLLEHTWETIRETRAINGLEFSYIHADSSIRTLSVSAHYSIDPETGMEYVEGICTDITEHKRSEMALRKNEQLLRQAQETAHMGSWAINLFDSTLEWSEETYSILGITKNDVPLLNLDFYFGFVPVEEHEMLSALIEEGVRTQSGISCVHSIRRPNGEIRIVREEGRIDQWRDGIPSIAVGSIQDITEQHHLEREILESRERFKRLIEDLGDDFVVFKHTLDNVIQYVSPGVEAMFGISPEEAVGKKVSDIISWTEVTLHRMPDFMKRLHQLGSAHTDEADIYNRDGSIMHLGISLRLIHDSDGNAEYIEGILEDITERKRIQDALKESEERLQLAMTASNDGIWDCDLTTQKAYFSPNWRAMLGGYTEDELPSTPYTVSNLLHPDDKDRTSFSTDPDDFIDVDRFESEYRLKHKDGHWINILSRGKVVKDTSGKPVRIIGTHIDQTQRKRLEEQLQVFQRFAETSGHGFGMAAIDKQINYLNPTLKRLLGLPNDHPYQEMNFDMFYRDACRERINSEIIPALHSIGQWTGEMELIRTDGVSIPTIENFFLIRSDDGQPSIIADIIIPIADIKEREEALRKAREDAETANRAKSEFLANMSHEIRTPMNAIIGMSHLAQGTELTPKQKDYIGKIDNAARSLLDLIDDVLDFSKIEAGKLELESHPFHLNQILERVVELMSVKATERSIEILTDIDYSLSQQLIGDPVRLTQILNNLVGNAVKFTEQGEVIISAKILSYIDDDIVVEFSIADTGIGVAEEHREKLFQAFTQADGSITRKYGGTGLGLAITKQLVELMNGDIWMESELGRGSQFTFHIPFQVFDQDLFETAIPQPPEEMQSKRILVIHPSAPFQSIISKHLAHLSLRPFMAASMEEALIELQSAGNDPFEFILVNSQLQGNNDATSLNRLRAAVQNPPPILLMAASYPKTEDLTTPAAIGFSGIIHKPVTITSLLQDLITGKSGNPDVPAAQNPANTPAKPKLGTCRVLLVEDNSINQDVARELLVKFGMEVSIAWNGKEALDMVQQTRFDIILMDIQMPVMDGFTATREIRKLNNPAMNSIPIIAITAHVRTGDREKCLAAGMNGYLPKPIDPEELFNTLAKWDPGNVAVPYKKETKKAEGDTSWQQPLLDHGIEVAIALENIGGNDAFYKRMLKKFVREYTGGGQRIRSHIEAVDYDSAYIIAHSLKSVAGYIGARVMWQKAASLSHALNERFEELTPELNEFEDELIRLLATIRASVPDDKQ